MRVERSDRISPIIPEKQPPVITGPSIPVKDSINNPVRPSCFRSILQILSRFMTKFKDLIFSLWNQNGREEPLPEPPPLPPPPPEPAPIEEKPIEEKKKEVFDDLGFSQGYDFASGKYTHLFRFKGKELVKMFLYQEVHVDHMIHPVDVPCITVESATVFPKEITSEQLKKIKAHLIELIRLEESRLVAKVRLVVLNYQSPMIDILKEPFKLERKFKKDHKEFTIFKLE